MAQLVSVRPSVREDSPELIPRCDLESLFRPLSFTCKKIPVKRSTDREMGYNKCTVSLSLISNMMAISSYRRKIRSLYLFLFTFLTCLVLCMELPPPTGVVAKPLLSWVPEDFLARRRVLRCLPQYITRGLL